MTGEVKATYESVAVSTRIRLARNFQEYPFPGRLEKDAHAQEQAAEMIRRIGDELNRIEDFRLYTMADIPNGTAAFLKERNLISRDLLAHRRISAVYVSRDESISVMVNEEDHIREQYFTKGFDLQRAYERIAGIDEAIGASTPFAYDEEFGYLTACPTNLGTGMRASVMLFLPALSRRGVIRTIMPILSKKGLTVRGAFGEGSGAEGELFQVSNENTLGDSEGEILQEVERTVSAVVKAEIAERRRMRVEEGVSLRDKLLRSYGILTHCATLGLGEFMALAADVKLGLALGFFDDEGDDDADRTAEELMYGMEDIIVGMRPANIDELNGAPLSAQEQDIYRAEYVSKALRGMRFSV